MFSALHRYELGTPSQHAIQAQALQAKTIWLQLSRFFRLSRLFLFLFLRFSIYLRERE